MNSKLTKLVMNFALVAAMMHLPFAVQAQEDAEPTGKAAVQTKLAIELGAPFGDNMILQREMDVPVWGWSKPGTKITVEFAPRPGSGQAGQKQQTEAGKDGKWTLKLKPLKASAEPAEMTITSSDGKKVVLKNVLVGEVWMASGQSNMQWKPVKCDVGKLLARIAESVKAGKEKQPVIREFENTSVVSALHPIEHATGAWKVDQFSDCSAIAFAFAYELHKELGVPIGILNCSFSMTSIRAWTPRCGFKDGKDEETRAIYNSILVNDPALPEHKAAWDTFYASVESTLKEGKAITNSPPGNFADNRDATWMFNGKMNPVVPFAIRGAIWNQCYSSMFEGVNYYHRLHSLIRGWREVWGQGDFPVYFHQLYAPGANDGLTLNDMGEMRLGFWLARDIPNVGMASQIDITGGIHYYDKAVPGKRLALHALKNQYPSTTLRAGVKAKDLVADGPMFKSYEVKGDKLIVNLDFANGGLLVGQMTPAKTMEGPAVIENGDDKVTLFCLADKDRVWHRAKIKIAGDKVELTAAGVKEPHGVAYGCNGVGALPNLYNKAMLPLAPFIYYDNKLVSSKAMTPDVQAWPDNPIKVEGVKVDPSMAGKLYEYRKMPLVSQQFRDNAVLQADMPVTFWGSTRKYGEWQPGPEKGDCKVDFVFGDIKKTIPVTPGMKEWQVTVPPMKASAAPMMLKVTFVIDGEVVHERVCTNMVVGDVWYVAAPPMAAINAGTTASNGLVRVMARKAQRDRSLRLSRFSVSTSTAPGGTGASTWDDAKGGLAGMLGQRIAAKTGKPVGIIFMPSASGKDLAEPELKNWIDSQSLPQAPSLADDFKQLAGMDPGTEYYAAFGKSYIEAWKKYWTDYIPKMIAEKHVPDGSAWGIYPSFGGKITTEASQSYNILTCPFNPGSVKGIIFLTGEAMFKKDQGANFGEQFTALANGWKAKFACPDPAFFYTIPSQALAPKITPPKALQGRSIAVEIKSWPNPKAPATSDWSALIEKVMGEIYK